MIGGRGEIMTSCASVCLTILLFVTTVLVTLLFACKKVKTCDLTTWVCFLFNHLCNIISN